MRPQPTTPPGGCIDGRLQALRGTKTISRPDPGFHATQILDVPSQGEGVHSTRHSAVVRVPERVHFPGQVGQGLTGLVVA